MKKILVMLFILSLGLPSWAQQTAQRKVYINGTLLQKEILLTLETMYRVRILDGRYWYDPQSGWWGQEGGPVAGAIMPGLALGGPLRADASKGTTGIFINGRQINTREWQVLNRIMGEPVKKGRYWVDAWGNAGYVGRREAVANLYRTASYHQFADSGEQSPIPPSLFSKSFNTDTGFGSGGGDFYIMGKDFSYTNF